MVYLFVGMEGTPSELQVSFSFILGFACVPCFPVSPLVSLSLPSPVVLRPFSCESCLVFVSFPYTDLLLIGNGFVLPFSARPFSLLVQLRSSNIWHWPGSDYDRLLEEFYNDPEVSDCAIPQRSDWVAFCI